MKARCLACMVAVVLLSGCASTSPNAGSVTENISSGVTVRRDGNEMIFCRGKEKKTVSAFHELADVKFFSAAKAPVIVAVTLETGYPGWTLVCFRLSPKEKKSFTVAPVVVDPKDPNGKKYIVNSVEGISDDGTKLRITVQTGSGNRTAFLDLASEKVSFPK